MPPMPDCDLVSKSARINLHEILLEILSSFGMIRLQAKRLLESLAGSVWIAHQEQDDACGIVRVGMIGIESDYLAKARQGLRIGILFEREQSERIMCSRKAGEYFESSLEVCFSAIVATCLIFDNSAVVQGQVVI